MSRVGRRRVRAVAGKELREYRRNRSVVAGMTIIPLVFVLTPLVQVFTATPADLERGDWLVYLLGIPAVVPTVIAAHAIAGERRQGTLEPVLATPVSAGELLLGKAIAALTPSIVVSYVVFAAVVAAISVFAEPRVASAVLRGSAIVAYVLFTPLVAGWSIWLGIIVSTRFRDVRTAQQVAIPISLPSFAVALLVALHVIPATAPTATLLAAILVCLNVLGWRIGAALFDTEALITR